jgi:hypothetical protein
VFSRVGRQRRSDRDAHQLTYQQDATCTSNTPPRRQSVYQNQIYQYQKPSCRYFYERDVYLHLWTHVSTLAGIEPSCLAVQQQVKGGTVPTPNGSKVSGIVAHGASVQTALRDAITTHDGTYNGNGISIGFLRVRVYRTRDTDRGDTALRAGVREHQGVSSKQQKPTKASSAEFLTRETDGKHPLNPASGG